MLTWYLFAYVLSRALCISRMIASLLKICSCRPIVEHLKGQDDIAELIGIIFASAEEKQDELRVFFLDSGLSSIRARNRQPHASSHFPRAVNMVRALIVEEHIRPYGPIFVIDMLDGFIRWLLKTYTTLAETEKPAFKSFCTQWLSNALLLPK